MQAFDFQTEYRKLLTPTIVGSMTLIHENKGRLDWLMEESSVTLDEWREPARLRRAEAYCRAEGLSVSEDRLKKLVREKTLPQSRDERQLAGYRDACAKILEHYEYISLRPGDILQLHRDLYKYDGRDAGGHYREAASSPASVLDALCDSYTAAVNEGVMDPLLLIPLFVRGFLMVCPFEVGNGQMGRLLTSLLLLRSGYTVEKYVCPEWPDTDSPMGCANDYAPFTTDFLHALAGAYRELSERAELLTDRSLSKPDRVREAIRNKEGTITKSDIIRLCPDVSRITVQRALSELLKSGEIIKIGGGRYTSYAWNITNGKESNYEQRDQE